MDFNEYQKKALETAAYSDSYAIIYPALKLSGEAGEVSEKVGKILRDKGGNFKTEGFVEDIKKELGDVLWYIAAMASDLGLTLDEIASHNIQKLADRKNRGVIQGSGDNR